MKEFDDQKYFFDRHDKGLFLSNCEFATTTTRRNKPDENISKKACQ